MRRLLYLQIFAIVLVVLFTCGKEKNLPQVFSSREALGMKIFFDRNLSNPVGQSCGSCHSAFTAFSDPNHNATSPGAVDGAFGNRNTPALAYISFTPPFRFNAEEQNYFGGFFLDGRASSLEEQATKPFFNPIEMHLKDAEMLAEKIRMASYFSEYEKIYGSGHDATTILTNVANALASFERSARFQPFSSKFDAYMQGQASLTREEAFGMDIFRDTLKGKCAQCHTMEPDPASGKILFTDFTYDNIGVPKNRDNRFYSLPRTLNSDGVAFVDIGLGAITKNTEHDGLFKVPTLRNIASTGPYFHNGIFNTLEEVVHFYNKRDVGSFDAPEVSRNVNSDELGNLQLTEAEEKAIVAFLKTLTDGYK